MSAWVKTGNVVGQDSGATICVELLDLQRKWIGGSYPAGFKGTKDWRLVQGETGIAPKGAAYVRVMTYLWKGCTGTARFDDVNVEIMNFLPMRRVPQALVSADHCSRERTCRIRLLAREG